LTRNPHRDILSTYLKTMKHIFISKISNDGITEDTEFEFFNSEAQIDGRGKFQFSKEKLERIAENFNNSIIGHDIAVNVNHDPENKAVAWIKNGSMTVSESEAVPGKFSLFGKLEKYTTKGMEYIKEGTYRYFSIEITDSIDSIIDGAVKTYKDVVFAIALTNNPAVKDLSPTFSRKEKDFSISRGNMDITQIIGTFSAKKLTKESKSLFSEMISQFSEEEKEEVKEEIDAIENAKEPEETESEKTEPEKTEEKPDENETDNFSQKFPEQFKGMEKMKAQIASQELIIRENKFSKMFENEMVITESKGVGFLASAKGEVKRFCSKLSDAQMTEFSQIVKLITSANFSQAINNDESDMDSQENISKYEKQLIDRGVPPIEAAAKAIDKFIN